MGYTLHKTAKLRSRHSYMTCPSTMATIILQIYHLLFCNGNGNITAISHALRHARQRSHYKYNTCSSILATVTLQLYHMQFDMHGMPANESPDMHGMPAIESPDTHLCGGRESGGLRRMFWRVPVHVCVSVYIFGDCVYLALFLLFLQVIPLHFYFPLALILYPHIFKYTT